MTDRIREIATVYAANVYEVDNLYNAIVALVYDEIEACAKVAEAHRSGPRSTRQLIANDIAAAIRARKS